MNNFRKAILELDKTNYEGVICRDDNSKVIKVGNFSVGKTVCYTTPVKRECAEIIRFEQSWAVFRSGRVEIRKLEGWVPNPEYTGEMLNTHKTENC